MHMRSRRKRGLCLALLAAWLGALLLSAAAAAAESQTVEDDWAAAQKSLYAAAERYRGTYLKLGDITTAPEMTRIFDMYIAPTATREEARRCFAQGFTGEKAGSTYVSMPYLKGIPTEAWGEIVGERIRRAAPEKSPVFPLNQETKDRLTALGLSPKTTLCKYIWVPNYEYAAYAFYSPDRKTWAFLVESLGMMAGSEKRRQVRNYHTALKPGTVYSSGEVRDDLLANVSGAFFLDEWESLIQDYYRDAEKFAAVKIEWETPSNAREGYILELDRAHVTPYYRLKIETRQDAENLLRAYRPGNLSQFLEQDGYVIPFWSMETTWADNQGRQGDGNSASGKGRHAGAGGTVSAPMVRVFIPKRGVRPGCAADAERHPENGVCTGDHQGAVHEYPLLFRWDSVLRRRKGSVRLHLLPLCRGILPRVTRRHGGDGALVRGERPVPDPGRKRPHGRHDAGFHRELDKRSVELTPAQTETAKKDRLPAGGWQPVFCPFSR